MKKFTFFLVLVFIVMLANGQKPLTIHPKMEAAKEKFARISHRHAFLISHSNLEMKWNNSFGNPVKSAAATMLLDSTITQVWNEMTQTLEKDSKEEFTYNSEMKNNMWISSEWDETSGMWYVWSKTEVSHNPEGKVDTMSFYESYEQGAELKLTSKLHAFYGETGMLDSVQHWYTEDQVNWELEGKQIYHYNSSGQLTEMEMWSLEEEEGEEYMSVMRFVFTYTNSGRMETSSMFFLFDEEEMLFFKTFYNYDGTDRLTYTEDWSLNLMSFELGKSSRTDYEFNAAGDISLETYSEWDPVGETWVDDYTDEYTYYDFNNSEGPYSSFMLFFGIVEEMPVAGKAVAEIETMEWVEGSAQLSEKTTFYYSEGTNTFAGNLSKVEFSVYPNPAREKVTFNWSENQQSLFLEIYLVTGSRIFEKQIRSGVPVSVKGLENGVYLYNLKNGKQTVHTGRFIKN